jgi:hypothetical protein
MAEGHRRVRLPVLTRISIKSFTLYRLRPELTVEARAGVFCLAGANGLGKSSFIAALNYALTGGVAPPSASIQQLSKYRRDTVRYSEAYFSGRIGEMDRPNAEASLEFSVGDYLFSITRGFFESYDLRALSVRDLNGNVLYEDGPLVDSEQRQLEYEEWLTRATGLQTFDQFVFLQHFVLSFDEWRRLLFWDPRATELVLYLALGLDPSLARRADELRKAASAAGSLARNAQYQATTARQELRKVSAELASAPGIDPAEVQRQASAQQRIDELVIDRHRLAQQTADARIELAEASARQLSIRTTYEERFAARISDRSVSGVHPLVSLTLSDNLCRVCGTQHDHQPEAILTALETHECPLCHAQLPEVKPDHARRELQELDRRLREAAAQAASLARTAERLQNEARETENELRELQALIAAFESKHSVSLEALTRGDNADVQLRMDSLQSAVDVAMSRKEDQLRLRAEALAELQPIQTQLMQAWREAEVEFVPRFRGLAESFIGLPLQIELDQGPGMLESAHLVLKVDSSHRRKSEQLSESQRFFLDIALRMSLAQHMSGGTPACLYVDTPEGALDIAYEARAGEMFSSFVASGDQLVMTANVNTSQLLRRMASRCGNANMQLVRMTDWTTLSDVQVAEEGLFAEAFELIEKALATPRGDSE